jgi:hypothetical protein
MGGADPKLRSSGAQTLLLWELIQLSANLSRSFDFEGSMIENVEKSFRGFGARQYRYFRVWKDNRGFVSKSKDLFKKEIRRSLMNK